MCRFISQCWGCSLSGNRGSARRIRAIASGHPAALRRDGLCTEKVAADKRREVRTTAASLIPVLCAAQAVRGDRITVRVVTPCAGCTVLPPMSADPDGPDSNTA